MDGAGDSRPGKIWIHQTGSEKVAVKEYGHICTRDDHSRGTFKLTAPVTSIT